MPWLPRTCTLSLGSTGSGALQGSASSSSLALSEPKRDVQEQRLDARLSPAKYISAWIGRQGNSQTPSSSAPGLRCNHRHSWIFSPSMPILISYFDRQLTLSTSKISAQGIWDGRHWGEQGRSQLLLQILQPHHLAWKREMKCFSATRPSTASHPLLSLFVGKFRLWGTELCTVPVQTSTDSSAALPVSHQARCDRMQPHLIWGEGQTGELNQCFQPFLDLEITSVHRPQVKVYQAPVFLHDLHLLNLKYHMHKIEFFRYNTIKKKPNKPKPPKIPNNNTPPQNQPTNPQPPPQK